MGSEVETNRPKRDDEVLVSDRARERAAQALRSSFERGRFDAEELERRTAGALAAQTRGDLRRVTGDLPRQPGGRRRRRPVPVWQWPAMPFVLLVRAARRRRR